MSSSEELPRFPARALEGHKGQFGAVGVIGGRCDRDAYMVGGPSLAALAALRAGCGLARLALPEPVLPAGLSIAQEATGAPLPVGENGQILGHEAAGVIDRLAVDCDALVIGPGLGTGEGAVAATLRVVSQREAPVVVDADALTCLSQIPELQRDLNCSAVLTPHPGEFRRLAARHAIEADPTADDSRRQAAEALAQRLACVVVLKGARTVVSDGRRTWADSTVCSALATAGSGDVLSGVIGSLLAQTLAGHTHIAIDTFDCARLAVVAHGHAAVRWSQNRRASGGMLARDLLDQLPAGVELLRGAGSESEV